MSDQFRQGDVLLRKVTPHHPYKVGATKVERVDGRLILAYGEKTGHAHAVLDEEAELLRPQSGNMILVLTRPSELSHEEHGTITLDPGDYEVVMQRQQSAREDRQPEPRAKYD